MYTNRTEGLHIDPIQCILKVFVTYDLMDVLQSALLSGVYMSMRSFKRFFKCKIKQSDEARFIITRELYKSVAIYIKCAYFKSRYGDGRQLSICHTTVWSQRKDNC